MRRMLVVVGILAVVLVGGVSMVWTGLPSQGSFLHDQIQLPAPLVPFGGDSSGS